jgi:hypothetical protein
MLVQVIAEQMPGWQAKQVKARAKNALTRSREVKDKKDSKKEPDAHTLFCERLHEIAAEVCLVASLGLPFWQVSVTALLAIAANRIVL